MCGYGDTALWIDETVWSVPHFESEFWQMGCVSSQKSWLPPNKGLVVLTTPGSGSPAYTNLARWCWIAENRHCHQKQSRMNTVIMPPLCPIYISNILQAVKCWLTRWLQICCPFVKIHVTSCYLGDQNNLTSCWHDFTRSAGSEWLIWSFGGGGIGHHLLFTATHSVIVACLITQTIPARLKAIWE